jgi:hypothetical protein
MKQISYSRHRFPSSIIQHAVWWHCQSKVNRRQQAQMRLPLDHKLTPLIQRGRAIGLEVMATVEMAFLIEVVVN